MIEWSPPTASGTHAGRDAWLKNASMSAWHCSSEKRLGIGTSPTSATARGATSGAIRSDVLVRPDALDRAHRARTEPRAGAVGDAEVHRHADQRDVEIAEAARRCASGRNGAARNVAGSENGHLRWSTP